MVSLDKIREEMQRRLVIDRELNSVEVNADTIDEALADASVQLDTRVNDLEFEVVEKGSNGFLGIGKKPWKLRIYQNQEVAAKKRKSASDDLFANSAFEGASLITSKDGLFYVHRFGSSIKLKVLPPVGEGKPVDIKEILDKVKRSDTEKFDESLISKLAKNGTDGEYVVVGTYKNISAADATISVEVTKDEMHAFIVVDAPTMGGADMTADVIIRNLKAQGILLGIDEQKVSDFVDSPVYGTPCEVATGVEPENGHDSYISYNFETDVNKLKARESTSGNMDFKELNKIQNVVVGQTLATKVAATRGKGGKTLFGHYLEAKNGKENPVVLGENVEFASDGVTIVAAKDGQVLLVNGKITVEPLLVLDTVSVKSGNITFLGSVIVKGNVEDDYNITASGTVDIGGTVGKCHIDAGGDVILHQGVFGKKEGSIKAGKSLWGKFIQEVKIEVEENVIATDSLMNCEVTAMKNIVLHGKKAQIIGGHYFATEEICARTIGSVGGADTVLSVGVDPRAKKKLDELQTVQGDLVKELESVELDIGTLENQKKIRRSLPHDKEENLTRLLERKEQISTESSEITREIEALQQHLRELKAVGKVKVEGTVYPGTKVYVRDALDEVRSEVTSLSFLYENTLVKRAKYEPPSVDVSKGPDGYSSN